MPPTWTVINDGLSGDALDVYRFLMDPWSSDGTRLTGAYIATKDGIYKTTSLPTPTWTQVLSAAQVEALIGANAGNAVNHFTRELVLPINVQNFAGAIVRKTKVVDPSYPWSYFVYSTDGGATWSCNTACEWRSESTDISPGQFAWPSHKTANTIYLSADVGSWNVTAGGNGATSAQGRIFRSADGGATWTYLGAYSPGTSVGNCYHYIVIPFADGSGTSYTDDTRAWRSHQIPGGGGGGGVIAVQLSTAFPGPYTPTSWTDKATAGMPATWLMDMCTWDEDYQYVLASADTAHAVWSTNDQAANWIDSGNLGDAAFYALSALPGNALFCAVAGARVAAPKARIYRTLDGGTTWVDALGDLNTALPSITSMRSIVPDWIKVT